METEWVVEIRFTFDTCSFLEGSIRDQFLVALLNFVCLCNSLRMYVFRWSASFFVFEDGYSGVFRSD